MVGKVLGIPGVERFGEVSWSAFQGAATSNDRHVRYGVPELLAESKVPCLRLGHLPVEVGEAQQQAHRPVFVDRRTA